MPDRTQRRPTQRATFQTLLGPFAIDINHAAAPVTADYFQRLIEAHAFDGTTIFRIVTTANGTLRRDWPIEVVQGGFKPGVDPPIGSIRHEPTAETGLTHHRWAVSTARDGPGEVYGSFFICMRDEPELDHGGRRHPDGLGFAVFGQVVAGFEVIEAIYRRAERDEFLMNEIDIISARLLNGA